MIICKYCGDRVDEADWPVVTRGKTKGQPARRCAPCIEYERTFNKQPIPEENYTFLMSQRLKIRKAKEKRDGHKSK